MTFDGCGHLAWWDPVSLPAEMIDAIEKPDYCAPKGAGDCRGMDFEGDRAPRFEAIEVEETGRVRFVGGPSLWGCS